MRRRRHDKIGKILAGYDQKWMLPNLGQVKIKDQKTKNKKPKAKKKKPCLHVWRRPHKCIAGCEVTTVWISR